MFDIKKITTVIFDLDGTIIDTEPIYNSCWQNACKFFGYNLTYENALNLRSLDSNLAQKYLENLFGKNFDYKEVRQKRKIFMKNWIDANGIKQKQNIQNVLNLLNKMKFKIAICSASSLENINYSLNIANINFNFDKIISAKSVIKGKPYPDVYLYACKSLDVLPEQVLVIEDSPNGILSAKRAGCNVLMIPDLTKPDEKLKENIDIVFNDLYEFEKFIQLINLKTH